MIETEPKVSISEQCQLLEINRGTHYYCKKGESDLNQMIMRRIDELYLEEPTWGSRKMRDRLRLEGYTVNRKRIQRLMCVLGIQAIYQKPNLSRPDPKAGIYPYLLKGIDIRYANHVWSTDITYIRLKHGFVYLCAVIDWYSRKILSWELSTTMDKSFCISTMERALRLYGDPSIFNSDQGCQFTSPVFTGILEDKDIRISMDGKGRALDNIFMERFWRTIKYDEVYLKDYEDVAECRFSLDSFISRYNSFRPHQSLEGKTPDSVYAAGLRSIVIEDKAYSVKKVS